MEVEAHPDGLMLFARGVHVHFDEHHDPRLHDAEELVDEALGLARDLLSPAMRIRELCAGGKPYRWVMEYSDGAGWRGEQETGLLVWNYLGRRSERVYQNHALPGRLGGEPPGA